MDKVKAANILKVDEHVTSEDLLYQYNFQREWALKAIQNASSQAMKQVYQEKLNDIETAYSYLSSTRTEKGKSFKAPEINLNLKTSHWLIIVSLLLVVGSTVAYFQIRKNKAENYLTDGITLFDNAKLQGDTHSLSKAKDLFEKAEELGSSKGKFYHGLALYNLGDKQLGMVKMDRAVQEGYSDSTDQSFMFYLQWKIQLEKK